MTIKEFFKIVHIDGMYVVNILDKDGDLYDKEPVLDDPYLDDLYCADEKILRVDIEQDIYTIVNIWVDVDKMYE